MDIKDIFMNGFKSKIGYSFTYKDLAEFEAIIDFYEQQCKKQKEVINKAVLELVNIDGNLSNSQLSDRICNLINILKEVLE